jgi:hypothetical protein
LDIGKDSGQNPHRVFMGGVATFSVWQRPAVDQHRPFCFCAIVLHGLGFAGALSEVRYQNGLPIESSLTLDAPARDVGIITEETMRLGEFFRVGRKAHVEAETAVAQRRHFPQHIMSVGGSLPKLQMGRT